MEDEPHADHGSVGFLAMRFQKTTLKARASGAERTEVNREEGCNSGIVAVGSGVGNRGFLSPKYGGELERSSLPGADPRG